jgi:hypothetical protein
MSSNFHVFIVNFFCTFQPFPFLDDSSTEARDRALPLPLTGKTWPASQDHEINLFSYHWDTLGKDKEKTGKISPLKLF